MANLKEHIEIVHEKKRDFECTICQKSFPRKGNLERHNLSSKHQQNALSAN